MKSSWSSAFTQTIEKPLLRLKGGDSDDEYEVFLSYRKGDCDADAKNLATELNNAGRKTYVAVEVPGEDLMDSVFDAFEECKLAIIIGTEDYGTEDDTAFDSKEELEFIMKEEMPFYLVSRCSKFKDEETRSYLAGAPSISWPKGKKMPKTLVKNILSHIKDIETQTTKPENGFGKFTFVNGTTYEGMWINGQPNGFGKQVFFDGSVFEGSFLEGEREGLGTYTYGEGTDTPNDVYEGSYVNGNRDGEGKMLYKSGPRSGDVYIGSWKDNLYDGYGSYFYFKSKAKYDGLWKDGKKNGKGIFSFGGKRKGDVYHGEFKDDFMCGNGELKYSNGDHYVGQFENDEMHGDGTFLWYKTGNKYVGKFAFGKMDGHGELAYGPGSGKHGDSYVGDFVAGKRDGRGKYVKKGTKLMDADEKAWANDEVVKG